MIHAEQTLVALHTGSVNTADAVRQSFAFDLSNVTWPSAMIVAARLRIAARATPSRITISDPAAEAAYGYGVGGDPDGIDIPLTQAALRDLHEARGGFFYVDSVCRDSSGACSTLTTTSNCTLALCLETADEVQEAA